MPEWSTYVIGFTAQILFSGRLLLQWILSEKSKNVVTPRLFWQLSLLASFLLFVYGYLRDDFAIMLGQVVTYFIYIRNLQLQHEWEKIPWPLKTFLWIFPALIIVYYYNNNVFDLNKLIYGSTIPAWLIALGIGSQIAFNLRFIYQWIYSEKRKESVLPIGFWILSLFGSVVVLIYATFRRDPVLLVGHLMGSIAYSRNIFIHARR